MLRKGETLGIVGESGSGKTTLGRAILRMQATSGGRLVLEGQDITRSKGPALRRLRRRMQMVFQDPLSSLNPRHSIRTVLATPLLVHRLCPRREVELRVLDMLRRVGLPTWVADRYPHELSGGQVQRVAIGRALLLSPSLLLADEAVSKLDVSVRAQILNLLRDIQEELGLALIFITHDLEVARFLSDRISVMYLGRIIEEGSTDTIVMAPLHPYTRLLMGLDTRSAPCAGLTDVSEQSQGCRYAVHCPVRLARCATDTPALVSSSTDHAVACWAINPDGDRSEAL